MIDGGLWPVAWTALIVCITIYNLKRLKMEGSEVRLTETEIGTIESAVENLRGGSTHPYDSPEATDIRWRLAVELAGIAKRARETTDPE